MAKVIYNACYGGFSFSDAAAERLAALGVPEAVRRAGDPEERRHDLYIRQTPRHDPRLVAVVEQMGDAASGQGAKLRVWSQPGPCAYNITEHDGLERVEEVYCDGVAAGEEDA